MPRFRTVETSGNAQFEKRIFMLGAMVAGLLGILLFRAVVFRLKDNAQLEKVAMKQYTAVVQQSTERGRILDAAGRELAIDVTVDSVYANPREITDPVKTTAELAKILGTERSKLFERLSGRRKFAWVKRKITDEEAAKISAMNIPGIYMMKESSRSYPSRQLGASVLGAVGFDSKPLGGIELQYDDTLSLSNRPGSYGKDARGHLYLSPTDVKEKKTATIELTIDKTVQYIADRELQKGMEISNAKGGSAVVVDVNTGAILALSNWPTFDPNEYDKYPLTSWKNRAISDAYEPGSTFKVLIVASALDKGVVKTTDEFNCENGKLLVGNHTIGDSHPHGMLSVADIIRVSSNIGAYKVESKLDKPTVYSYLRAFGMGKPSGLDLPGEATGMLSSPKNWSELQYATIAFGQGVSATPLQMAMAFSAIANGGKLYKPYVVKRVVYGDGSELVNSGAEVVANPISESTSKTMIGLLTRVVETGGTGTLAASLDYKVGGKTGTAQKADPITRGYAKGKYYSSFVGIAPAEKPRIAVYIGVDEPSGGMYYGGQVAAPVFRKIVEGTLQYMKVPSSKLVADSTNVNALPPREAEGELAFVNDGDKQDFVEEQKATSGESLWKIPDFKGLTMRGVVEAVKDAEIELKFEGSGVAVEQSVGAGSVVPSGTSCKVVFKPMLYAGGV